jgi:hypothetical protein
VSTLVVCGNFVSFLMYLSFFYVLIMIASVMFSCIYVLSACFIFIYFHSPFACTLRFNSGATPWDVILRTPLGIQLGSKTYYVSHPKFLHALRVG